MPLRRAREITWQPRGIVDAVDGTNAPPGAMSLLANLVPDPATAGVFVPREAALIKTDFSGFFGGVWVTGFTIVGDLLYGLLADSLNPGHDEPFAYDLANDVFIAVTGVTAANTPATPPATGDWQPPILAQVAGRVVVTHPGFGVNLNTVVIGDTVFDQTNPSSHLYAAVIAGDPVITNVFPGMDVTGPGIPGNTKVLYAEAFREITTGDTTLGSANIANVVSTLDLATGMVVSGAGIPAGSTVVTAVGGLVVISHPATANAVGVTLTFSGANIYLSNRATIALTGQAYTISGLGGAYLGWFDVSGFQGQVRGNTLTGSPTITGNPSIVGVEVGMAISDGGINIVPGSYVISTRAVAVTTTGDTTSGSAVLTNVAGAIGFADVWPGAAVSGVGVPAGATVLSIAGASITISANATANGAGVTLFFSGARIEMSLSAVGTATNLSVSISGGTTAAPLWGAGNTIPTALPMPPVGVAQLNGRAYYACGMEGLICFSDTFAPTHNSSAFGIQQLKPSNGLPVTALGSLQLQSLVGGIVQGLIAFQADTAMQQITGDPSTSDLKMNSLPVATGTHAPLTICSGKDGLYFVSPDGLRLVTFDGKVTEPIGVAGSGIVAPFQNSPYPSRMCAAINGRVIRISTPIAGTVAREYWFHHNRQVWTGPHSCAAAIIGNWSNSFILFPDPSITPGAPPALWVSDDVPDSTATYIENSANLSWGYSTVLLPDNQAGTMNTMVQTTLAISYLNTLPDFDCAFADEFGTVLDQVSLPGTAPAPGWGGFSWGGMVWAAQGPAFQERWIPWTIGLTFKQGHVIIMGQSDISVRIGNLYMQHQILGYRQVNAA